MPQRGVGDPLLKGSDWEQVKVYWRRQHPTCVKCGRPINCTPGYRGPDALDVGHIVSRDEAKAMGWTRAQINAITNTQPECRTCSRSSGASYGNRKRAATRCPRAPIEADEW